MAIERAPLAPEAVHEAGHAVMARHLGLHLEQVWINPSEGAGRVCLPENVMPDQNQALLILAASRACMRAFDIDTLHDQGPFRDVVEMRKIFDERYRDDDENEVAQCHRIAELDVKVDEFFHRQDVRAAARALAEVLTRENEVDGPRAEAIIDRHLMSGQANARSAIRN